MAVTKRYSEAEKERGFAAMVLASGNAAAAARNLKDDGTPIPVSTLLSWRRKDPQRYSRVRDACETARLADTADSWASLSDKNVATAHLYADALHKAAKTADPKTAARNLRDITVSAAVAFDKSSAARENDAVVIAANAEDALGILRRKGLVVDSTAEELPSTTEPALPSKG